MKKSEKNEKNENNMLDTTNQKDQEGISKNNNKLKVDEKDKKQTKNQ